VLLNLLVCVTICTARFYFCTWKWFVLLYFAISIQYRLLLLTIVLCLVMMLRCFLAVASHLIGHGDPLVCAMNYRGAGDEIKFVPELK
jgi:hypothetical protein